MLVSVIIPAYNAEKFLCEAIESVIDQTYKNIEIIIVDDASKDNTYNLALSLAAKCSLPIKVIKHYKNLGSAVARNTGIKQSSGKFIAFLDADDFWPENKIELQMSVLKNKKVHIVHGGLINFSEDGFIKVDTEEKHQWRKKVNFKLLLEDNRVITPTVLIVKEILEDVGYFDESLRHCEDYDLWLRLSRKNYKFSYINKVLLYRRIHTNQLTSNDLLHMEYAIKVLKKHRKYIKNYSELKSWYIGYSRRLIFLANVYLSYNKKKALKYAVLSLVYNPTENIKWKISKILKSMLL